MPGVQLDELATDPRAGCNLLFIRRDEQTDFNARVVHFLARLGQGFFGGNHIQSAFGRHFQPPLRHDANDVRFQFQRDADDFRHVGHFQVQPRLDNFTQFPDVAVLHVPAVFAQMRGDAVRAGGLANARGLDRIAVRRIRARDNAPRATSQRGQC